MSTGFLRNRKVLLGAGIVAVLGGSVWGVTAYRNSKKNALPKELVQLVKDPNADPRKIWEAVHTAEQQGKHLTEDQRHQLFEAGHNAMEARIDKRIDEYLAAKTPVEKQALIDKSLDEWMARRKEGEQRAAQWQKDHPGQTDPRDRRGPGGPQNANSSGGSTGQAAAANPGSTGGAGGQAGPGGPGGRRGQATREQRMERTQSRNPDQEARHRAYWEAMQKRAQERGIPMPWFGGGRPGGGGPPMGGR
jgi:hypothetical protein